MSGVAGGSIKANPDYVAYTAPAAKGDCLDTGINMKFFSDAACTAGKELKDNKVAAAF